MIPPLIAETPSMDSVPIAFDESDPKAMLTFEILKDYYVGQEHPILVFTGRDGFSWLVVPKTITRVFRDADTLTNNTAKALRISPTPGS